ncbi:MAG: pilus assembly protein TadG-related protein, partial [Pseudomonadota bacterium]
MRRFINDEQGGILIFSLVLMILTFAFMGLVVDTGRTLVTHSRLQGYVDHLAVAAAAELDQESDAIARATAAIENDYINKASLKGTNGGEDFAVDQVIFLTGSPNVPANSRMLTQDAINGLITTDSLEATHVVLTAASSDVDWSLLQFANSVGHVGGQQSFEVNTWAAATLKSFGGCHTTILAACMPSGVDTEGLEAGQQIQFTKNRDSAWEGGEYAPVTNLQDDALGTCSGYSGIQQSLCLMAINNPSCLGSTIDVSSDVTDSLPVHAALNTRFGIFDPALGAIAFEPQVSPDMNTIAGELYTCTAEDYDAVSDSMGLPTAECYHNGDCDIVAGKVSLGQLEEYWSQNHGATQFPEDAYTRYDVYKYETFASLLDPEGVEDSTTNICNPNTTAVADRRRFKIAVMPCDEMGNAITHEDVEPEQILDVFLSEPVQRHEMITFDGDYDNQPIVRGDILNSELPAHKGDGRSIDPYLDSYGVTIDVHLSLISQGVTASDDFLPGEDKYEENVPMVFDTVDISGQDSDLRSTDRGNILIMSEDGDSNDPDDEKYGGWFLIHFDEPTTVNSMIVFDTEQGGVIRAYDDIVTDPTGEFTTDHGTGELKPFKHTDWKKIDDVPQPPKQEHDPRELGHLTVPNLGDGRHVRLEIGYDNVRTLAYFMPDSGGIDDISFNNQKVGPKDTDTLTVEVVDVLNAEEGAITRAPVL